MTICCDAEHLTGYYDIKYWRGAFQKIRVKTPTVEAAAVLWSGREMLTRILNSSNRPLQACELPAICLLASCLVERLQRPHWQSSLRVPAWCCHPQAHVPTQNQRVGALDRSCPWGGEQWREGGQDIGNILPHRMMSSQLKNIQRFKVVYKIIPPKEDI